jgi:transcriptional regulator with XRE-family HTH domain
MMTNASFPVINLQQTGRNIERRRRDAGMSVRELQAYFGFEYPQAIYKWQHGECLPTVDNLLALSRILHVRMEDLLVCEDQEAIFLEKMRTDHVSRKDSHDPPFLIHYISLQNIISQKQKVVFECQYRMQLSSPDQVLDILTGTVQEFSSCGSVNQLLSKGRKRGFS